MILGPGDLSARGVLQIGSRQQNLYNWRPGKMHASAKLGRVKHILAITRKTREYSRAHGKRKKADTRAGSELAKLFLRWHQWSICGSLDGLRRWNLRGGRGAIKTHVPHSQFGCDNLHRGETNMSGLAAWGFTCVFLII